MQALGARRNEFLLSDVKEMTVQGFKFLGRSIKMGSQYMLTYQQGSRGHQFLGNGQSALSSKWVDTSADLSPKRVTPLGGVHCCQPFLYWLIHMTHNRFGAHQKGLNRNDLVQPLKTT